MTFTDLKTYYGSAAKAALALGIRRQVVYRWQDKVPALYQYKAHHFSGGELPLDPDLAGPK